MPRLAFAVTFEDALARIRTRIDAWPPFLSPPLPAAAEVTLRRHAAGLDGAGDGGELPFTFIHAWQQGSTLPFDPGMTRYVEEAATTVLALKSAKNPDTLDALLEHLLALETGGRLTQLAIDLGGIDAEALEASLIGQLHRPIPGVMFYYDIPALRHWALCQGEYDFLGAAHSMRELRNYMPFPGVGLRARLLFAMAPGRFSALTLSEADPFAALQLLASLDTADALQLAARGRQKRIRALALAWFVGGGARSFSDNEMKGLLSVLKASAGDFPEWGGLMKGFGRHPLAYGILAEPIGAVLAGECTAHALSWLRHADIVRDTGDVRVHYATLIDRLAADADPAHLKHISRLAYDLWVRAVSQHPDPFLYPQRSCIDALLDRHCTSMSSQRLLAEIDSLRASAHDQSRERFVSSVQANSAHHQLLTLYQPLRRAELKTSHTNDDVFLDLLGGGDTGYFGLRYRYPQARKSIQRHTIGWSRQTRGSDAGNRRF